MIRHGLGLGRTIVNIAAIAVVIIADRWHPPGPVLGYTCRETWWTDGND